MTDSLTTPTSAFDNLVDFPYSPRFHAWHDLKMHYVDHRLVDTPENAPVALLLHGMPTWSYLYRSMIPGLAGAGYRCIAPDHMGFGRSDKPTDPNWYSIARHTEILTTLIESLDLQNITLVCQDWGGPIGLAQAAMMPERFSRLTIMNTWLHHDEFEYSKGIRNWYKHWHEGGLFARPCPNVAALLSLAAGHINQREMIDAIVEDLVPAAHAPGRSTFDAYAAPFRGLDDAAYNGLRRFPLSIPIDTAFQGNGAAQRLHYNTLFEHKRPVHFIWGGADEIFTQEWGRSWADRFGTATFDLIAEAGHFLQESHGDEIVKILLRRIAEES